MNPLLWLFLTHLGQWVFTVASACTASWAFFRFLGAKWIDSRFQKDLEDFKAKKNADLELIKSAQAVELEHLRGRIQRLFDRTAKLHQNEFEALPKIWGLMTIAVSETIKFTAVSQVYPNISHMGSGELEEFFKTSELAEWEQGVLRGLEGEPQDKELRKMLFWVRLRRVQRCHSDFQNYLISHGIFIEPDLREKFLDLSNLNYDAIKERAINPDFSSLLDTDCFSKGDLMQREGFKRMTIIQELVQARLWDAEKLVEPASAQRGQSIV